MELAECSLDAQKIRQASLHQKIFYFLQIALGMEFMHRSGLVHRDLKPDNVLISAKAPFHAKVCDFGQARMTHGNVVSLSMGAVGTIGYLAPEVLVLKCFSRSGDVYSFGMLMFSLLFEIMAGRNPQELLYSRGSVPSEIFLGKTALPLLEHLEISKAVNAQTFDDTDCMNFEWVVELLLRCVRCGTAFATVRPSFSEIVETILKMWKIKVGKGVGERNEYIEKLRSTSLLLRRQTDEGLEEEIFPRSTLLDMIQHVENNALLEDKVKRKAQENVLLQEEVKRIQEAGNLKWMAAMTEIEQLRETLEKERHNTGLLREENARLKKERGEHYEENRRLQTELKKAKSENETLREVLRTR